MRPFNDIRIILIMLGILTLMTIRLQVNASSQAQSDITTKLSTGTGNLAFHLLAKLADKEPADNLLISPISLGLALTLAYNGAGGKTSKEMAETLGFTGISLDEVNKAQSQLIQAIESQDQSVQLLSANALWLKKGINLKPSFAEQAKNYFKSETSCLDFTDPSSVPIINKWAAEHTKNKIQTIIDKLDPATVLIITNAVYFKGTWLKPFNLRSTEENSQFKSVGGQLKIAMMQQSGHFLYAEDSTAQAIELPYGNGQIAMYILLPRNQSNYQNFVNTLTLTGFETFIGKMRPSIGNIKLPRFSIAYGADLATMFSELGMRTAFDPKSANFKEMAEVSFPLYIGRLLHKAVMNVNETGTEATATTTVTMLPGAVLSQARPFVMNVDHPFIVVIQERETKEILFLAAVTKPEKLEAPKVKSVTQMPEDTVLEP